MDAVVYVLCALTSTLCAFLLFRAYLKKRERLLFWSSGCFACLALNNVLLYIDVMVYPEVDMLIPRTIPALVGVFVLLYGLIQEMTA